MIENAVNIQCQNSNTPYVLTDPHATMTQKP